MQDIKISIKDWAKDDRPRAPGQRRARLTERTGGTLRLAGPVHRGLVHAGLGLGVHRRYGRVRSHGRLAAGRVPGTRPRPTATNYYANPGRAPERWAATVGAQRVGLSATDARRVGDGGPGAAHLPRTLRRRRCRLVHSGSSPALPGHLRSERLQRLHPVS